MYFMGVSYICFVYHILVYGEAEAKCREYAATKGVGTFAKPQNHPFFTKLGTVLKRTLEKCDRENGMMYAWIFMHFH